jgi:hypothetical protein
MDKIDEIHSMSDAWRDFVYFCEIIGHNVVEIEHIWKSSDSTFLWPKWLLVY